MSQVQPMGYASKPKWITALGVAFLLAPLGNFLWSLAAYGVERWWDPNVWGIWLPHVEPYVWLMMFLVAASGVSLLVVRKWSWILAVAALSFVLIHSFFLLPHIVGSTNTAIVVLLSLITVGSIAFVGFSPFRRPYLNPRLRWWETSPRYKADIQVKVGEIEQPGILVDISRTGALVEWPSASMPDVSENTKLDLPMGLSLYARVARKTESGYGFTFNSKFNPESNKTLKGFLSQLAKDPTKLIR